MRRNVLSIGLLVMILLWSCQPQEKFKINEMYNGFSLVEKKFVKEVNAECLYFIHKKSGARLLKIASDDENKLFNIAFKTLPENDYGTPHIMEHSVLNGSTNFPVKSPFDVLSKGSLNTFLNAMTGSCFTTYPVASMNDKDYFNLMHVYLDAVFNPLIYKDPRILKQEGWHYELDSIDGDITYKGVVYNEMKGVYSSPESELEYQKSKILFPDNTFGVESGGYPLAIPKLTYDYFINFHKKYYHPSNSYILLYGNADLEKELAFIDSAYLSKYDKSDAKYDIPVQKPFKAMKTAEKTYAVPEGSDVNHKTYLDLSFVTGSTTNRELSMSLDVLAEALVNNESAPVRLALQEAGIGKDVKCYMTDSYQNTFDIQVQDANPEEAENFKQIVFETLKKVSEEGLDKTMLEGIINRTEFNLKEGNTPQKGLRYLFMNYQGWLFNDDPFLGLEFDAPLAKVKESISTNKLEELIKTELLSNPHSLLLVLKPEPGLQAKVDPQIKEELAQYKASLSEDELAKLVESTKDLKDYQKKEDSPEALAKIPMLSLSDINPDVEWYNVDEKKVDDAKVLHLNEFTNNILYTSSYFDLRVLPQELIPYAKLLTSLLGKLNTETYTYGDLDNQLNINTGGFYVSISSYLKDRSEDNLVPKLNVSVKSTEDKASQMFGLITEILTKSKYNDPERLKALLTRIQSNEESNVKNSGMGVAINRLRSYCSKSGMFREETGGLDYYRFVTHLMDNFDGMKDEIVQKLSQTASLLFQKNNIIGGIVCANENYPAYESGFKSLVEALPQGNANMVDWKFDVEKRNEGILTASKVQYVTKGYDFKKLGYEWSGKMMVLEQILSTDWLQNQVRVIGGAYGGFCNFNSAGQVYFGSYRDPNLKETLDNYDATPGYLKSFDADSSAMTRYIIGTIANLDSPKTPSQKGSIAFARYFKHDTKEQLLKERADILATTAEDIRSMEKMVSDILQQNTLCVYGNEDKLTENKKLFKETVQLTD